MMHRCTHIYYCLQNGLLIIFQKTFNINEDLMAAVAIGINELMN